MSTKTKKGKKVALVGDLSQLTLVGEVITWRPGSGDRTLAKIKQALKDTGLDEKAAKDLSSETAFQRALKKFEDAVLVDEVRADADEILYQFTRKKLVKAADPKDTPEWEFDKDCYVTLRKLTGEVQSKKKELASKLQEEVDRCKEARNGSDVTTVVQRLIESRPEMDLFPIRDQGGAYFVFAQHAEFITQLDDFLGKIGGKVNRFPVPKGTQIGDAAVTDTVAEGMAQLVENHRTAIAGLSVSTRKDTIEAVAEKINSTRVKIEAYASYLEDRKADLLKALDDANEELKVQVAAVAKAKAELPAEEQPIGMRVLAVLNGVPKKMAQIIAEAKLERECYGFLNEEAKAGRVVKTKQGYVLAAQ